MRWRLCDKLLRPVVNEGAILRSPYASDEPRFLRAFPQEFNFLIKIHGSLNSWQRLFPLQNDRRRSILPSRSVTHLLVQPLSDSLLPTGGQVLLWWLPRVVVPPRKHGLNMLCLLHLIEGQDEREGRLLRLLLLLRRLPLFGPET